MANYKIVFQGTECSETEHHELQCYFNEAGEIYLSIESDGIQHICLDISTAIKLSKTLRTHINLAKEII